MAKNWCFCFARNTATVHQANAWAHPVCFVSSLRRCLAGSHSSEKEGTFLDCMYLGFRPHLLIHLIFRGCQSRVLGGWSTECWEQWGSRSVTGLTTALQTSSSLTGSSRRTRYLRISDKRVINISTPVACFLWTFTTKFDWTT